MTSAVASSSSSSSSVTATAPVVAADPLRYATVWEDPAVLRAGLAVQAGDRVLSIASAGDNVFALLLDDPSSIVAVDLSATQLAVCELKAAALRRLTTDGLHRFCGFADDTPANRREVWRTLRGDLGAAARRWFDAHSDVIDHGVIHAGTLERWFRFFGTRALPLVQRRKTIEALLAAPTLQAQQAVFHDHFNHPAWRFLCRTFFSQALMKRGRDPAFLRFVDDDSVGTTMMRRTERLLTELHVKESPFATWLLTGGPSTRFLPPWARAEHRDVIVARLDRIQWVQGDLRQVAAREGARQPFDAMNLSDIFEYMSVDDSQATWRTLAQVSTPQARLLWWLLLVDRRPNAADACSPLVADPDRAADLWRRDAGFFYGGLVLASPRRPQTPQG
jgi:S-adenosylmethionine-diacylglycerol 3-amino-3-carboxypropyl transferase